MSIKSIKFEGDWKASGKFTGRFIRTKEDLVEIQWGAHRVFLPVSFLQEILEGQWEADSIERHARMVA